MRKNYKGNNRIARYLEGGLDVLVPHGHGGGAVLVAVDLLAARHPQVTHQLPLLPQLRHHKPVHHFPLEGACRVFSAALLVVPGGDSVDGISEENE